MKPAITELKRLTIHFYPLHIGRFVIRNKSFQNWLRRHKEIATLYSQIGFRGCVQGGEALSFLTPLVRKTMRPTAPELTGHKVLDCFFF